MKIFRRFNGRFPLVVLLFLLTALVVGCAATPEPAGKAASETPAWPHERSDLPPDPALQFGQLPNGVRYVLMPNATPKSRVSMHLAVQAGSYHETDDQRGLAHFVEHMVFNGSDHFEPGELVKYFQSIGMEFGPDVNGRTGFYHTVYDIFLPEGEREDLARGLLVFRDYAAGAHMAQAEIDRERGIILAEKLARDSAGYRTFVEEFHFEFPEARFPQRLPIGVEPVLKTADRPLLKDYYDTWYRPERLVLVMVGDFNPDEATELIAERFGDLDARAPARPEPDPGSVDHDGVKTFHHYEAESGTTQVALQILDRIEPEPDSFAFQKEMLLKSMADQILRNRLEKLARRPDVDFTDATAASGRYIRYVRYAVVAAETGADGWEKTLSILEQELRRALEHGFTEAEVERARKDFVARLKRAAAEAGTRESGRIARQIVNHVNNDRVFMSPEAERDQFAPVIEQATADDLHRAFKDAWAADHRLVQVTGNANIQPDGDAEAALLSAYESSRRVAVAPPEKERQVAFPYLNPPQETGAIAKRRNLDDLGVVQVDFENGLRLNVKATDFSDNEIIANLRFGNGAASEPADNPGLAEVAENVVNESGLGGLNRDELERAMAGKTTGLGFSVREGDFLFRGQTTPEELELFFQRLHAQLVDPAFRPDAHALVLERMSQEYENMRRSVEGAVALEVRRFLAGGDRRFGMPDMEHIQSVTLSDVKNWVGPAIRRDPLELSIVGDLDPDAVIDLAARHLGALERADAPAHSRRPGGPDFPRGEDLTVRVDTRIPKGLVQMAYPTADIWDIGQTRRLATLSNVFSDRLREELRERLGATYSPYAYNDPSRTYDGYGLMRAVVSIDPEDADTVTEAIRKIIADLNENGVTPEELERTLKPTLNGIRDSRRENGYWLNTVLTGSREHPEQIEWARTIEADYRSITAAEVSRLAAVFLKNEAAAEVVIRPVPAVAEAAAGAGG